MGDDTLLFVPDMCKLYDSDDAYLISTYRPHSRIISLVHIVPFDRFYLSMLKRASRVILAVSYLKMKTVPRGYEQIASGFHKIKSMAFSPTLQR